MNEQKFKCVFEINKRLVLKKIASLLIRINHCHILLACIYLLYVFISTKIEQILNVSLLYYSQIRWTIRKKDLMI